MRVIWDNPPHTNCIRATAERIGKHNYRVEMSCSTRSCITYGRTLKQAFYNGLDFQLNGFFQNYKGRPLSLKQ